MYSAIIFGAGGQDGFYLNSLLTQSGIEVTGVSRSEGKWIKGDVGDLHFVSELIKRLKPTFVFHLAANSTTRHDAQFENHRTICTGTLNILESVYQHSQRTKVFLSGSGLQFVNNGGPIHESFPFDPNSPYSVSRIHSVYAARYYRKLGIATYVGYFFNHDSPLRSERHVNQKIVAAVKRIHQGSLEKLELGNIQVKKEFSFAGDSMQSICKLIQGDEVFEAVIGDGRAYSIEHWLEICFGHFNLNWKDHVLLSDRFVPEYDILVSNPSTMHSLGWKPETDIKQLAEMMINQK